MRSLTINSFVVLKCINDQDRILATIREITDINSRTIMSILRNFRDRGLICAEDITTYKHILSRVGYIYFREQNMNVYSITNQGKQILKDNLDKIERVF